MVHLRSLELFKPGTAGVWSFTEYEGISWVDLPPHDATISVWGGGVEDAATITTAEKMVPLQDASLPSLARCRLLRFCDSGFGWRSASEQVYETAVMPHIFDTPFEQWHKVDNVDYTRCVAVVHAPRRYLVRDVVSHSPVTPKWGCAVSFPGKQRCRGSMCAKSSPMRHCP